jgi:Zn-dependent metalloprotease
MIHALKKGTASKSAGDSFARTGITAGIHGLSYVTYDRTYHGLHVVGGDIVVTTDAAGKVLNTAVAQDRVISVGTTARVGSADAVATARASLAVVESASTPRLVVLAWGAPRLAWEVKLTGVKANGAQSVSSVYVDAVTGKVADSMDLVRDGTGNSFYNGVVTISTSGPIRFMYNPSLAGDPNCWSTAIPNTEVHAAAGPLNHWFYLVARGNNPAGGPASPICAGGPASVTGVGIQKAGQIYYNAMLAKTSTWRYANVRLASLNAAVNLFGASSPECATVKAAWNAVSVPVQAGEPTCGGGGGTTVTSPSPAPDLLARLPQALWQTGRQICGRSVQPP